MVANPSNFHVMLLGLKTHDSIVLDIGNVSIDVVNSVKLLGNTIDSKLKQTTKPAPSLESQII